MANETEKREGKHKKGEDVGSADLWCHMIRNDVEPLVIEATDKKKLLDSAFTYQYSNYLTGL